MSYFKEDTATSNIHASARSAGAVESGNSSGGRDNVQHLEENAVGYPGRAKILLTITVPQRIECKDIKILELDASHL